MKKLRLEIDELEVEAFPTTEVERDGTGTVFANSQNENCGHTPDQQCVADVTWDLYMCQRTYMCDTAMECNLTD